MNPLTEFRSGTAVHFAALAVCALLILTLGVTGRRSDSARRSGALRQSIGYGCLVVWLLNTASWLTPARFSWDRSLPLQVCNLANIFGALAVLRQQRLSQGVIYFWGLGLCIWAFLTPTLDVGPARFGFWIFWTYHLFIGLALVYVLTFDRFRPQATDLLSSLFVTYAYVAIVAAIDLAFGWNYGFVGPGRPTAPTPVDVLGPYPLRILWMTLAGSAVFVLLWLPWRDRRGGGTPKSVPAQRSNRSRNSAGKSGQDSGTRPNSA